MKGFSHPEGEAQKRFKCSFNTVAKSFNHTGGGGGAQQISTL